METVSLLRSPEESELVPAYRVHEPPREFCALWKKRLLEVKVPFVFDQGEKLISRVFFHTEWWSGDFLIDRWYFYDEETI